MPHSAIDRDGQESDNLTRRQFLRASAAGACTGALSLADLAAFASLPTPPKRCILLFLVGGPSHLDTWDPKPDAPAEVRGPFKSIATSVPGIRLSEHFPRMAAMAERYALVRSLHHSAAPIHETGQQLVQTGRLCEANQDFPHFGAVLSALRGPCHVGLPAIDVDPGERRGVRPPVRYRRADAAPLASVILPTPITRTGVTVSHGQGAGILGPRHEPFLLHGDPASSILLHREKSTLRDRYGRDTFGQSCLLARRLVEEGVHCVTVNMFDTVFNEVTWDCHADGGCLASSLDDYRATLCPRFDRAYTALLEDLAQRGLLDSTLVLAVGEFGRSPYLNPCGGRDHWPRCWTALLAGAGVRGGQVVGASDSLGAEPADRPVSPADLAATVYHALGHDPRGPLPGRQDLPLTDGNVVSELFL
jgi:hypothetical protein